MWNIRVFIFRDRRTIETSLIKVSQLINRIFDICIVILSNISSFWINVWISYSKIVKFFAHIHYYYPIYISQKYSKLVINSRPIMSLHLPSFHNLQLYTYNYYDQSNLFFITLLYFHRLYSQSPSYASPRKFHASLKLSTEHLLTNELSHHIHFCYHWLHTLMITHSVHYLRTQTFHCHQYCSTADKHVH